MPYLTKFNYAEPHLTKKVQYFWDFFRHANAKLGRLEDFGFESPLFRVENIVYQFDTNPEKSRSYIYNHIDGLIKYHLLYLKKYSEFEAFVDYLIQYQESSRADKKEFVNDRSFIDECRRVIEILKNELFEDALLRAIRLMGCKHKLRTHAKEIRYYASVILSEFRFQEFSKKDLDGIYKKVMTTDIYKYQFPPNQFHDVLPINITQEKRSYIENLNFKTQIEGINNFRLNSRNEAIFYFKLINYELEDDNFLEFQYDDVTLLSSQHEEIKRLRNLATTGLSIDHFFDDEERPYIVASIMLSYNSQDLAIEVAYTKILKTLRRLNRIFNHEGEVVSHVVLLKTVGGSMGQNAKFKTKIRKLTKSNSEKLKDHPYEYLKNCSASSKQQLLRLEYLYLESYSERDLAGLWQYIENMLHPQVDFKGEYKNVFATISLLEYRMYTRQMIQGEFSVMISQFSLDPKEIGISREEQRKFQGGKWTIPMRSFKAKTDRAYLRYMIRLYEKEVSKKNLQSVYEYIMTLVTELSEYRNSILHSGLANTKLRIKLQTVFPIFILYFRRTIIHYIADNPTMEYKDILTKIYMDGEQLRSGL